MNRMNLLKDIFLPRKSAQLGFDADLYNQIYQGIHFFSRGYAGVHRFVSLLYI